MKEFEKHYQVGNIVKIRKQPKMARRYGFLIDTEHIIQEPPEGRLNTAMSVWINDRTGLPVQLDFPYYVWTGKNINTVVKRKRRNL